MAMLLHFSVVTICFNACKVIDNTILSILSQDYKNIEYIIIDGGSTDGTVDKIKQYRDKIAYWVSEPDSGIYDAMNKGIKVANGDFILFMNAGDCLCTSHVLKDVAKDIVHIGINNAIYYGDCIHKLKYKTHHATAYSIDFIKRSMPFSHQSTFVPLKLAKKMPFNTYYKLAGDYDFFLKQYLRGTKYIHIRKPISIIELSEGATISNFKISQQEAYKIHLHYGFSRFRSYISYQECLFRFYISRIVKKILGYN